MAYMNQERKKAIAPKVAAVLKKYGLKGSLAVEHHSTLVLNIRSGEIDFDTSKGRSVNTYWYKEHYSGRPLEFLEEVMPLLNAGNHDNSDIMTDYFDVGWYVDINIGQWDKAYILA
jgi:hypothetical protein